MIAPEIKEIMQLFRRERTLALRWAERNRHEGFTILSKPHLDDAAMYDRWLLALESLADADQVTLLTNAIEALTSTLEQERRESAALLQRLRDVVRFAKSRTDTQEPWPPELVAAQALLSKYPTDATPTE